MQIKFICLGLAFQKARLFFILVFALAPLPSLAGVYFKLNIGDCAKCSIIVSDIHAMEPIDTIWVVVPEYLKDERKEMIHNLGFNKFDKFRYKFSDSLYNYIDKHSDVATSELAIIRNGRLVYSAPMEVQYLNAIRLNILLDVQNKFCFAPKVPKSLREIIHYDQYVIGMDLYKNIMVFDLLEKEYQEIKSNDEGHLDFIYKELYGKDYERKMPFIRHMVASKPNFKPENFMGCIMLDKGRVLMSYLPWDYKIEGEDTNVFMSNLIVVYDLKKKKFTSSFVADTNASFAKYSLFRLLRLKGGVYGLFAGSDKPRVYRLSFDENKGLYSSKSNPLARSFPSNYFKRVGMLYHMAVRDSKNTLLFYMADSIYSHVHKKLIKIPYPNIKKDLSVIENSSNHYDTKDSLFHLIYTIKGQNFNPMYYLVFDEFGNRKKFLPFKNSKEGPAVFLNPYERLRFNNKEKCFKREKIID